MDRGARWATVLGAAESRTLLRDRAHTHAQTSQGADDTHPSVEPAAWRLLLSASSRSPRQCSRACIGAGR